MSIYRDRAYRDMVSRLRAAKTQEDVDSVVKAAHSKLDAQQFGKLLKKVLRRRQQLPGRYE